MEINLKKVGKIIFCSKILCDKSAIEIPNINVIIEKQRLNSLIK